MHPTSPYAAPDLIDRPRSAVRVAEQIYLCYPGGGRSRDGAPRADRRG
jgi:hypothetical protein